MRTVIPFFLLVMVNGCSSSIQTVHVPANTPIALSTSLRRESHPGFTAQEQAMIASARHYLEHQWHRQVDAYYSVEKTSEGFEVFVNQVADYEGSKPMFAPGSGSIVYLDDRGKFIRYFPGE
jgi:hypothetical protein